MNVRLAFLILAASLTVSMDAQLPYGPIPVTVFPPYPTASSPIVLRFHSPQLFAVRSVVRTGNHFAFDFTACRITCVQVVDEDLGTLPPGTYTYELFIEGNPTNVTGSFAVAPIPDTPALSPLAMAVLSTLLAAAAWLALARR